MYRGSRGAAPVVPPPAVGEKNKFSWLALADGVLALVLRALRLATEWVGNDGEEVWSACL